MSSPSTKRKSSSEDDKPLSASATSSSRTSSSKNDHSRGGTSSLITHSTTYSLPKPAPTYSSSPSLSLSRPFMETSYPPPHPPMTSSDVSSEMQSYAVTEPSDDALNRAFMETSDPPPCPPAASSNVPSEPQSYTTADRSRDDSDDDDSGVELSFRPVHDDDMSSLGCSLMSKDVTRREPDGFKSDDIYSTPDIPEGTSSPPSRHKSSTKTRKNRRQQQGSSRNENHLLALDPVEESSVETETLKSPKTSSNHTNPKQTIEEIMNRGVEGQPTMRSKSMKKTPVSWHSTDNPKVHRIARSFTQAPMGGSSSDSSNVGGPPTVGSAREDDEAVNRALKSSSFFSHDHSMGDSGNVYST